MSEVSELRTRRRVILERILALFATPAAAAGWLTTPNPALRLATPLIMLAGAWPDDLQDLETMLYYLESGQAS